MTEETTRARGNPLIVIGDKLERRPHLIALLEELRDENMLLEPEERIKYAVCRDSTEVALALRKYLESVKMILIGPGLMGTQVAVARMLASKAHIVMIIDPKTNPLGTDPLSYQQTQRNLEDLGVIIALAKNASEDFFEPIVKEYVLSDASTAADLESLTPEQRAAMIDKRLDAVNKFPSLPETQRKVSQIDDMDPPKKWAEAIDPDVATRTVILKILNSARYGFRSRVETIEQAVALASAKTIREIVTACQIRQIFQKTKESTIEQFWRHSLAVGFYAKLFSLPADPAAQSSQQKTEFERFQIEETQGAQLEEAGLWEKFDLGEKDDVFTAGLLHDIGKVTMLMCLEESLQLVTALIDSEVADATQESKLWARPVLEIERFLMKDIDHQVIGGRLAEKWELDEHLTQAISHHHNVHGASSDLLKIVALANLAASTLFPYPATPEQHPFPQLFARIDKALKKKKGSKNLAADVEEIINEDIFEDLVDVINRLSVPTALWEIVDFKTFFRLCYVLSPKIKSSAIAFLQQTA